MNASIGNTPRRAAHTVLRAHWLRRSFASVCFDDLSLGDAVKIIAERRAEASFDYVVTPNVDHLVRLHGRDTEQHGAYANAMLSLCDSAIVWSMMRALGRTVTHAPGSDLVGLISGNVLREGDTVTIIGCAPAVVDSFRELHPGVIVHHHEPPMGFMGDPSQVEACLRFVERNPSRFVFLCVGSPRQEQIAEQLKARGRAVGVGLCCGVSLHFLTGNVKRAPGWMRRIGLEWLFRLLQEPGRLARRYLLDGPQIFVLFAREWRTRSLQTANQEG